MNVPSSLRGAANIGKRCIVTILTACIYGLRILFGPYGACAFTVSCVDYAIDQLHTQPLHVALWRTITRLLGCHPLRRTVG